MASLRNVQTGTDIFLLPHHSFGRRKESVDTYIDNPEISKFHLIVEWVSDHWILRDVSRNGVWIDQKKVEPMKAYRLKQGQIIQLTQLDSEAWLVRDLSPPCNQLLPRDQNTAVLKLHDHQLLPSDSDPKLALYFCSDRQFWIIETLADQTPYDENIGRSLKHGDIITCGNNRWQLFLPKHEGATVPSNNQIALNSFEFEFDVSLNEENVGLVLRTGKTIVNLGERIHHYLLFYLACHRVKDADNGLQSKDQGWVSNAILVKELGLDMAHINIQIYRVRKQFTEELDDICGLKDLVQRRTGTMRIGIDSSKLTLRNSHNQRTAILPAIKTSSFQ